ncbi:hypothetical protein PENTCL1PPCAC_640, partial [Pristionchus entomophagus]
WIMLNCIIYLSYACAVVILIIYLIIFMTLRKRRRRMSTIDTSFKPSTAQLKLLRQSVVVFALYSASMALVFIISFQDPPHFNLRVSFPDLAYAENLLNLSIAAVYPICFLAMSGDLRKSSISN